MIQPTNPTWLSPTSSEQSFSTSPGKSKTQSEQRADNDTTFVTTDKYSVQHYVHTCCLVGLARDERCDQ